MTSKRLTDDILSDIRVELSEEFDRNFGRKAFFGNKWPPRKFHNNKGSLMSVTGKLRRSVRSAVRGNAVVFTSSVPYAAVHNEGGRIRVTARMKGFFWRRYKETRDEQWKWLALKKVGDAIDIPERRFIGDAPEVRKLVEKIIDENIEAAVGDAMRRT